LNMQFVQFVVDNGLTLGTPFALTVGQKALA
jgi:hypothetical protein